MQKSNSMVPTFDTFPLFPVKSYSESQCDLLIGIETALAAGVRRMQVLTEILVGNLPLVFANLERLLRYTEASRILLLLSSPEYEDRVTYECETFLSHEDGQPFSHLFEVHSNLTLPIGEDAQVYVSTIRKAYAQVKRWQQETALSGGSSALSGLFDVVVVFDHLSGSLMWRTVLDAFDATTIAYSGSLDQRTLDMLGRWVVCTRYVQSDVECILGEFLMQESAMPMSEEGTVQPDWAVSEGLPSSRQVLFSLPCWAWRRGHGDTKGFAQLYNLVEGMVAPGHMHA